METPEEKRKRKELEHKILSMPPNGKVNQKYKSLMQEMQKFTGARTKAQIEEQSNIINDYTSRLSSRSYMPYTPSQNLSPVGKYYMDEMTEANKLVIFFGFNGMLAQKYSVVEDRGREEITARMQFAGDKVPYSIKQHGDFMVVVEQMQDTPNMLREIPFDDALNIIRIGISKLQVEEFQDAEVDEFDDNCVDTCKPGNHACGK